MMLFPATKGMGNRNITAMGVYHTNITGKGVFRTDGRAMWKRAG